MTVISVDNTKEIPWRKPVIHVRTTNEAEALETLAEMATWGGVVLEEKVYRWANDFYGVVKDERKAQ